MEGEPQPGAGPEPTGNQQEEHERERPEHPRIYVASLSDYNDGVLHGDWIDAAENDETVHDQIAAMLARSPTTPHAEEYAIHDYEGFGAYHVNEYESITTVTKIGRGITEHGLAFAAWAAQHYGDDEALDRFEDAFLGSYDSLEEFGSELLDSGGIENVIEEHVPESFRNYLRLDVDAFVNDLIASGEITTVHHNDGVWIFEGNT